jgi:hypothetical protein
MTREEIMGFAIDCAGQLEWDSPKDPESFTFNYHELEKFSELIIKECIALAMVARVAEREECAAEIEALRNANEAFAARQEWWNDRMVELEGAVAAEREACAAICERHATGFDGEELSDWKSGYGDGAGACFNVIRARGEK